MRRRLVLLHGGGNGAGYSSTPCPAPTLLRPAGEHLRQRAVISASPHACTVHCIAKYTVTTPTLNKRNNTDMDDVRTLYSAAITQGRWSAVCQGVVNSVSAVSSVLRCSQQCQCSQQCVKVQTAVCQGAVSRVSVQSAVCQGAVSSVPRCSQQCVKVQSAVCQGAVSSVSRCSQECVKVQSAVCQCSQQCVKVQSAVCQSAVSSVNAISSVSRCSQQCISAVSSVSRCSQQCAKEQSAVSMQSAVCQDAVSSVSVQSAVCQGNNASRRQACQCYEQRQCRQLCPARDETSVTVLPETQRLLHEGDRGECNGVSLLRNAGDLRYYDPG
ncbi:uncharacterized protein LOC135108219 [Scylla paramamosain]|uniref:uncharacterized protein LOC135108219 n=1 Tax=Scylla paramamosain TaxID=85552 RepID=UPI0030833605